jgi:hypothetical protein
VRFTITRSGIPSRFQRERSGKRETKAHMRRWRCGGRLSWLESASVMAPPLDPVGLMPSYDLIDAWPMTNGGPPCASDRSTPLTLTVN